MLRSDLEKLGALFAPGNGPVVEGEWRKRRCHSQKSTFGHFKPQTPNPEGEDCSQREGEVVSGRE
jgi:hypothetical protein